MNQPSPPAVVIDARDWLPPEPMERTLVELDRLPPGQELVLLLYREPFPLYAILDQRALLRQTTLHPDGTYAVHIRQRP